MIRNPLNTLLFFLPSQRFVDVLNDATTSYYSLDERVQFFISTNSKLHWGGVIHSTSILLMHSLPIQEPLCWCTVGWLCHAPRQPCTLVQDWWSWIVGVHEHGPPGTASWLSTVGNHLCLGLRSLPSLTASNFNFAEAHTSKAEKVLVSLWRSCHLVLHCTAVPTL